MTAKTTTFEYLLLFRGNNWTEDLSPEENKIAKFSLWFERVKNSGTFKGGHPLEHNDEIVEGRNAVTDDPYAESKEAIGGFFLLEVGSLDEATEIAKNFPGLNYGASVEVRPVAPECPLALSPSNAQPARASA